MNEKSIGRSTSAGNLRAVQSQKKPNVGDPKKDVAKVPPEVESRSYVDDRPSILSRTLTGKKGQKKERPFAEHKQSEEVIVTNWLGERKEEEPEIMPSVSSKAKVKNKTTQSKPSSQNTSPAFSRESAPRSKTPTLRGGRDFTRVLHSRANPEEKKVKVPTSRSPLAVSEEGKRTGKLSRTLSSAKDQLYLQITGKSPTPEREKTFSKTFGQTTSGKNIEKDLKVSFHFLTDQPPLTNNPFPTPRWEADAVNAPPAQSDARIEAIKKLEDELDNPDTLLGISVRDVGKDVGRIEARELEETLTSLLAGDVPGISKEKKKLIEQLNEQGRKEEREAIKQIVKQVNKSKDTDNPLIAVGEVVCVEVARELVRRLTRWADVHNAMAEAKKFAHVSLRDKVPVAKQWDENLGLDLANADGLYKLAQQVGKEIGETMKQQDLAKLSSLKQHCQPGSAIPGVIDEFYPLIAKKVAVEIAQSLMLRVEELPGTIFNADDTKIVVTRRPVPKVERPTVEAKGPITSAANPGINPPESTDPRATAQSPRNTAVQQESEDEGMTITNFPNPDTTNT